MRRILVLGCCALYIAFGFVAGAAHLHESADQHTQSRGLHLDHAHPGQESLQDGDVFYLSAMALRSLDVNVRLMPATVAVGATIDPPSTMSDRDETLPGQPRDPPPRIRTRPRAPPA